VHGAPCNPSGAAVGQRPGPAVGHPGLDALLWVKRPGESDGACGPSRRPAGEFDTALALALLRHGR
jgi:endoglucanase